MMMVFLDTNIFLYAAGRDHALREPCQRVLELHGNGMLEVTTSVEVVQEILYVLHRRGNIAAALNLSRHVLDLFPNLLSVSHQEMLRACDVMTQYSNLPARDAVHVATMLNHKLTTVVSADRHFDRVEYIRRVDPVNVDSLNE